METTEAASCPLCRASIAPGALKCPHCAEWIKVRCPHCQNLCPVGALDCAGCGQDLTVPPKPAGAVMLLRLLAGFYTLCAATMAWRMGAEAQAGGHAPGRGVAFSLAILVLLLLAWAHVVVARNLSWVAQVGLTTLATLSAFMGMSGIRDGADLVSGLLLGVLPLLVTVYCLVQSVRWHRHCQEPLPPLVPDPVRAGLIEVWPHLHRFCRRFLGLAVVAWVLGIMAGWALFLVMPEASFARCLVAGILTACLLAYPLFRVVHAGGDHRPAGARIDLGLTGAHLALAITGGLLLAQTLFSGPEQARIKARAGVPLVSFSTDRIEVRIGAQCALPLRVVPSAALTEVLFSVEEGPAGGQVDPDGSYRAPVQPGIYHVQACWRGNPSVKGRIQVQVLALTGTLQPLAGLSTGEGPNLPLPLDERRVLLLPCGPGLPQVLDTRAGSRTALPAMEPVRDTSVAVSLGQGQFLITGDLGANAASLLRFTGPGLDRRPVPQFAGRTGHGATLLEDGRILVCGGQVLGRTSSLMEIIDPGSASIAGKGVLNQARTRHTVTALGEGGVLVTGGLGSDGLPLKSCECVFLQPFFTGVCPDLVEARADHSATRLPDGNVLLVGGIDGQRQALKSIELFHRKTQFTSRLGELQVARSGHKGLLLVDGSVLVVGGRGQDGRPLASAEIIDPVTGKSRLLPFPQADKAPISAVRLSSGSAFVLSRAGAAPVYALE